MVRGNSYLSLFLPCLCTHEDTSMGYLQDPLQQEVSLRAEGLVFLAQEQSVRL